MKLNASVVITSDMKELDKAYEAVQMLESLGLPVSNETLEAIAQKEEEVLQNEIIPLIKQDLEPLVGKMRNSFQLQLTYSKEKGIDISVTEQQRPVRTETPVEVEDGYRKKRSVIRVTFPDKRVSFHKKSSETFALEAIASAKLSATGSSASTVAATAFSYVASFSFSVRLR